VPLHDRCAIFSAELGDWLCVLKSPPRSPKANSVCERVIERFSENVWTGSFRFLKARLPQSLKVYKSCISPTLRVSGLGVKQPLAAAH
jgi:hypothetical protein